MTTTEKANEFEIAQMVTELMDSLRKEQRDQVMAMLNTRYGVATPRKPYVSAGRRYGPKGKPRS